jgi:hypothetical protein
MTGPNPNEEPFVERVPEETTPSSSLPPRLRERLEARGQRENRRHGGGSLAVTLMILLLLVAAGGFIWWRSYNAPGNLAHDSAQPTSAMPDLTNTTFGIVVGGTYPTQEAALTERDRLSSQTSLPISIGQVAADGTTQFQVVVGTYYSRAEAESVGGSLQQKSIVKDWKVVPLSQSM